MVRTSNRADHFSCRRWGGGEREEERERGRERGGGERGERERGGRGREGKREREGEREREREREGERERMQLFPSHMYMCVYTCDWRSNPGITLITTEQLLGIGTEGRVSQFQA